jgi:predicted Holliday junction resolvase-like endonuclease
LEANVLNNILALALGLIIGLLLGLVYVLIWKARHTGAIRQDAIQRSLAVTVGKVSEQLVPYLPDFHFNPKDVRFLGSPVDLIVFDGLDAGAVRRVIFIEVKTGASGLSTRERQVRDAIQAGSVEWTELRVPSVPEMVRK